MHGSVVAAVAAADKLLSVMRYVTSTDASAHIHGGPKMRYPGFKFYDNFRKCASILSSFFSPLEQEIYDTYTMITPATSTLFCNRTT